MLFMLDEVEYTAVISFIYIEKQQLGALYFDICLSESYSRLSNKCRYEQIGS